MALQGDEALSPLFVLQRFGAPRPGRRLGGGLESDQQLLQRLDVMNRQQPLDVG
jgi:hypothetical protein